LHSIPFEIPPPKNEADFERMCAQVYGVVFDDRMPKMNGRSGQVQGGVDVFVKEPGVGRVGVQCKKYTLKPVKWEDVEDEVNKADKHKTPIKKLILATTAPNDATLLKKVQELSDEREAKGLFPVEIEFWGGTSATTSTVTRFFRTTTHHTRLARPIIGKRHRLVRLATSCWKHRRWCKALPVYHQRGQTP